MLSLEAAWYPGFQVNVPPGWRLDPRATDIYQLEFVSLNGLCLKTYLKQQTVMTTPQGFGPAWGPWTLPTLPPLASSSCSSGDYWMSPE